MEHRAAAILQMASHQFLWAPLFRVLIAQLPRFGLSQAGLKRLNAHSSKSQGLRGVWESGEGFLSVIPRWNSEGKREEHRETREKMKWVKKKKRQG